MFFRSWIGAGYNHIPLQVELCEGLSLVQALRDVQQKGSRSEEHSLHMYQVEELNVKV